MYQVTFISEAEIELATLDKVIAQRVLKKVHWLADHFNLVMPEPLTGHWQWMYKLRVGDYRVIYTFERNQQLMIINTSDSFCNKLIIKYFKKCLKI